MQQKKYNLLFLSSWYPNKFQPTLGIFIQRRAEAVAQFQSVFVLYITSDSTLTKNTYQIETTLENNVQVTRVYYKKVTNSFPGISNLQKLYRYLKAGYLGYKHLYNQKKSKPDAIHLNVVFPAGIIALLINYLYKIPIIISEHWTGYMPEDGNYKGFFMKYITKKVIKKSKAIIVEAENSKRVMLQHKLHGNYSIVPNVVDTEIFFPAEQKPDNKIIKMIHVSTLNDRQKNISGILRVVKRIAEYRSDIVLEVIGDSEEVPVFQQMASELGILNKYVFFNGKITDPVKVADKFKQSDFFLLFSNYECLPCVLIEAIASGIPIVSSNVGGIVEIVSEKNGLLVNVGNEDELYAALINMAANYNSYSPHTLHTEAQNKFSKIAVGRQINNVYHTYLKAN